MTDRKMATIRKVEEVRDIPEADKICAYRIGGWWVVDSVGKYSIDDLVVYCEINSWIPNEIAPFLSKGKEPREYEGIKGERLRTVKLRGVVSQGLLLPIDGYFDSIEIHEGMDVSELLVIVKYEPPIPAQLEGLIKGNFPSRIPKTDQERCLSGDTLILTENGHLTIKYIVDNSLKINVCSYNHDEKMIEFKLITAHSVISRRKNEWLKIKTRSGNEIVVTKNHKIWCEDILSYRQAKDICVGQKFIIKTD
jgi:RNA ligase (TIGR02306 family)